MKKFVVVLATSTLIGSSAIAADMVVKTSAPPPAPSPWDVAFGAAVMSDYNFRGITQSNHKPSVNAYFEPRYNVNENLQLYAGIGGYSIEFPNNAAAEIDFYAGIRPTFGKLALDFGVWYYYYPGGQTFNGRDASGVPSAAGCTNRPSAAAFALGQCNLIKGVESFIEYFAKATFSVTDSLAVGAGVYYDPSWMNYGAPGIYASGNAKYTLPATPGGWGGYLSGEVGHYWFGTTDAFYGSIDLPDYTTWNIGFGVTYKVFTVDFRYYDSDLSKAQCNVLTSDHTATFSPGNITPVINPSGLGSNWCGSAFVVTLKADLTAQANLK
jgi:hypothetical protein